MLGFAGIAQLVEQRIRNAKVGGSTPLAGTTLSSLFSALESSSTLKPHPYDRSVAFLLPTVVANLKENTRDNTRRPIGHRVDSQAPPLRKPAKRNRRRRFAPQ